MVVKPNYKPTNLQTTTHLTAPFTITMVVVLTGLVVNAEDHFLVN
jgi:hypothetical protein